MQATFTLAGQTFMCVDSAAKHDSSFTPSMSLFVDCADEAEIDDMFAKLSDGGQVFMPLNTYPFNSYPSATNSAGSRTNTGCRGSLTYRTDGLAGPSGNDLVNPALGGLRKYRRKSPPAF